jgi:hypothetical protein
MHTHTHAYYVHNDRYTVIHIRTTLADAPNAMIRFQLANSDKDT